MYNLIEEIVSNCFRCQICDGLREKGKTWSNKQGLWRYVKQVQGLKPIKVVGRARKDIQPLEALGYFRKRYCFQWHSIASVSYHGINTELKQVTF